jgi:formylglycine-generating enzyme required for sulfatase activity
MVWIASGTFRMGCHRHYPEEPPVRRVSIDGFLFAPDQNFPVRFSRVARICARRTTAAIYRPAARRAEAVDTSTSHVSDALLEREEHHEPQE